MKNDMSSTDTQAADAKWLRQSKLWDLLSIALLVSFGWLFLNPQIIIRFFG